MADKLYKIHYGGGIIRHNGENAKGQMNTTHFFEDSYHWIGYQKWLDAGNTPTEADEPPEGHIADPR